MDERSKVDGDSMTMDIPLDADVQCEDGLCGRSTYVIVDPVARAVTHIVVREQRFPHTEYVVPVDLIVESTPETIRLRCSGRELHRLDPFVETHYEEGNLDAFAYGPSQYWVWPYVVPEDEAMMPVETERVPPGEFAVRRGAQVEASDGHIGVVDGLLMDPESGQISHLILREGHLWGKRNVSIPVSQIAEIDANTVWLKLSKDEVQTLPEIPVRRAK
jgi:sporulation protein YlmC with PRC-barrel domain